MPVSLVLTARCHGHGLFVFVREILANAFDRSLFSACSAGVAEYLQGVIRGVCGIPVLKINKKQN